jgi:uncharacterized protein YbaR (Trm112 family)
MSYLYTFLGILGVLLWFNLRKRPPLPEQVQCSRRSALIELDEEERENGAFVCPECSTSNHLVRKPSEALLVSDGKSDGFQLVSFLLKPIVVCPHCETELALERGERERGEFVCTECRRRTDCTSKEESDLVKQFLHASTVQCPACERNISLDNDLRNAGTFACPKCGDTLDNGEEECSHHLLHLDKIR